MRKDWLYIKVHVEWCPLRKPSRMFFRILLCAGGEVGDGKKIGMCSSQTHKKLQGLQLKAMFPYGHPTKGNNACSLSPDSREGPEPTSSQTFIWACALLVPVKNRS